MTLAILVALDLGPGHEHVVDHAAALARALDGKLTLYHAVTVPDHRQPHWAFAHEHEVWDHAAAHARDALARQAARLDVPVEIAVEKHAAPDRAVADKIRHALPDLSIVATHQRTGLSHLVLGSVAERVIHEAHRPVLCLEAAGQAAWRPYRKIVVTTDLSALSRAAFPWASRLAKAFGASVVVIHVVPGPTLATLTGIPPVSAPVVNEQTLFRFVASDFEGIETRAQVYTGRVWERIVGCARGEQADLIVMATRGHDTLGDRILGSNTDRVLRHAPCPVLVA